ncbi:class I SAM-dependent methyltransferase [Lachnospiraceae bacterium 38-10]
MSDFYIMLKRIYKFFTVPVYKLEGTIAKKFIAHAYKRLFFSEWCVDNPEQFDHDIDLYYQWPSSNNPHWLERGVYNLIAIKQYQNPVLIELCCGEGFNTTRFYSKSCKKIWACDFDRKAIKEAKKKYSVPNVIFEVADIRTDIPERVDNLEPTNIIWDAAIEHFTEDEIDKIMCRLQKILNRKKGILSGHTIVEQGGGAKAA